MKDVAVSVRARLLNLSRETREPLQALMEHYAMGRLLYSEVLAFISTQCFEQ